ncbi:M23 family metallopeptidase [Saccharopolyspora sp. NFXS83]|uniref:murein hydrolase activator EnvC family protein n=1 Tax=Saccharopolyspora sp. NFXS83 TaxID=2993560 RepID=UPI00224B366F|nr:M23 family metallopeptidase [Saccharopolyspora sp. NFXS83]MCX2733754.1 M23 family metallopeptidase [Saccharopolyspora sp. NFXS83]
MLPLPRIFPVRAGHRRSGHVRSGLLTRLLPVLLIVAPAVFPATAATAPGAEPGVAPTPPQTGLHHPLHHPLPGSAVSRPFVPPTSAYGPGHRGVDLAGAPGATVAAADAGVVGYAGLLAGRPVVSIEHADGLRTTYEPVRPTVEAGRHVAASQPIGVLEPGHPGCAAPACLHWGARRDADYLDPLALLGGVEVRLLPWDAEAPAGS